MGENIRATIGRVRILQFLNARDLSVNYALSSGDIGDIVAPPSVSNKRAWGSSNLAALKQHRLVEPVGHCERGADTWAITSEGEDFLKDIADIVVSRGWQSPW